MQSLRVPLQRAVGTEGNGLTLTQKNEVITDFMSLLLAPNPDFEVDFFTNNEGKEEVEVSLVKTLSAYVIDELPKYRINEKLQDGTLIAIDCGVIGDIFSRLSCACIVKGNEIVIRTCIDDIFLTLKVETFSTDPVIMKLYLDAAHGFNSCAITFVHNNTGLTDVIRQVRERATTGSVYYVKRLISNQKFNMFDQTLSLENGVFY